MVHPLKAATTFDCDGCGHHASFHKLVSAEEEAILRERSNASHGGVGGQRMRIEEQGSGGGMVMKRIEEVEVVDVDAGEVDEFEGEEVVEVELPVRGKRRMIADGAASEGKGKGRVAFDLGEEVGGREEGGGYGEEEEGVGWTAGVRWGMGIEWMGGGGC